MKKTLLVVCLSMSASLASADVIDTFKSACLSNLGDPSAIAKRGNAMGFKMRNLKGNSWMGFNAKLDQSLQINAFTKFPFECAVTTSDVADPTALREQFFGELGLRDRRGLAKGKVNGRTYFFKHDTQGGKALVVYSE